MLNPIDLSTKAVLQTGIDFLKSPIGKFQIENPRLEAELLLSHVLGNSRSQMIIHSDRVISRDALSEYEKLLEKKTTQVPTAYLLGNAEFYGRKFYVNPSVLIPRPETEELVEWVIRSKHIADSVLDLCTGSGCIGLTLASEINLTYLCLSDLSTAALETVEQNTHFIRNINSGDLNMSQLHIDIIHSDLFNDIVKKDFHLIVSNPPYVLADEYDHLEAGVKDFEPQEALLLEKPAEFNKRLIQGAFQHLNSLGWVYLENSPVLTESLRLFFEMNGFVNIEIKKDLSGKDRFIRAQKPEKS